MLHYQQQKSSLTPETSIYTQVSSSSGSEPALRNLCTPTSKRTRHSNLIGCLGVTALPSYFSIFNIIADRQCKMKDDQMLQTTDIQWRTLEQEDRIRTQQRKRGAARRAGHEEFIRNIKGPGAYDELTC